MFERKNIISLLFAVVILAIGAGIIINVLKNKSENENIVETVSVKEVKKTPVSSEKSKSTE